MEIILPIHLATHEAKSDKNIPYNLTRHLRFCVTDRGSLFYSAHLSAQLSVHYVEYIYSVFMVLCSMIFWSISDKSS